MDTNDSFKYDNMSGESDTSLEWSTVLKHLPDDQSRLIQEDEFGITSASYDKLSKAGFSPMTTRVDARHHPEFVDKDMRDLVTLIDKLPFVKSNNGCAGHSMRHLLDRLRTDKDKGTKKEFKERKATMVSFAGAYIGLLFDEKDPRSYKFADILLRKLANFNNKDKSILIDYSWWRGGHLPEGISDLRLRWDILPPEKWLLRNKGISDLQHPNPANKSKEISNITNKYASNYPFDIEKINPKLAYELIYNYLYQDFYIENEINNKRKIEQIFGIISKTAESFIPEKYNGKIIGNPENEIKKHPKLQDSIQKLRLLEHSENWNALR